MLQTNQVVSSPVERRNNHRRSEGRKVACICCVTFSSKVGIKKKTTHTLYEGVLKRKRMAQNMDPIIIETILRKRKQRC